MLPATHAQHASGSGPARPHPPPLQQRRSLLGSTRKEKEAGRLAHGVTFGGVNGIGTGSGSGMGMGSGSGRNGVVIGNASGSGSTVPQKRKLGLGMGIGHGNPQGSKARREEDGRRREGEGSGSGSGVSTTTKRARGTASSAAPGAGGGEEGDEIRCRCGSSLDDGFSIACDVCGRWCHAACFGIAKESVPEEWKCWVCAPGGHPDLPPPIVPAANGRRRRASISTRRASTVDPAPAAVGVNNVSDTAAEEQLMEDERMQYVLIEDDIVPHANTQRKLRAYAATWRGVSALSTAPPETTGFGVAGKGHTPFVFPAPPPAHPTLLHPVVPPPSHSFSSIPSTIYPPGTPIPPPSASAPASFLPPTFALHAASPAPPRALLARYPSTITPSSVYLAAPTNGYAHAGLPKRFVHLVGPPLDVALDARGSGGRGRWVRSGCWPNAEVRAYVCPRADGRRRDGERAGVVEDESKTHFGIFATRALKEGEEIVVGWEWDDANAVHQMGEVAGVNNVNAFGIPAAQTPTQRHLIAQLANILHTLGGAECACTPAAVTSPAAPAHVPPVPASTRPPVSKDRRSVDRQEEGKGDGEVDGVERACVIRAIEDAVFPPIEPSFRPGQGHTDGEEMDVDIDIEGEDGVRMRGVSSSSSAASAPTPRLGATSSLAPPAVIRRVSMTPAAAAAASLHPHTSSSSSSSASGSTRTRTRKRLAGPGVPPPSPEAPDLRWGPLIGASRGVRAVESVRGSGGWGGVVLDRPQSPSALGSGLERRVVYGAFAPEGYGRDGFAGAGAGGGDAYGYGHGGYADAYAAGPSTSRTSASKDFAVREHAGGWDVVVDASYTTSSSSYVARASSSSHRAWEETEEDVDVDVVGDGDVRDKPPRSERAREKSRRAERAHVEERQVQEEICPPKMRKRWKSNAVGSTPVTQLAPLPRAATHAQMRPPSVPNKGKGKERALPEEAMDVDVDVETIDAEPAEIPFSPASPPFARPPPPHVQPASSALPPGTSPSTSFARLSLTSPHPAGPSGVPRPDWFSFGRGSMDVDILPQGGASIAPSRSDEEQSSSKVKAAGTADEAVEAVSSSAVAASAESPAEERAAVDARLSPPVSSVEPVVDAPVEPVVDVPLPDDDVNTSPTSDTTERYAAEQEHDHALLMTVGDEEPYRSSPQSPSPAPESPSEGRVTPEPVPRVLEDEGTNLDQPAASEMEEGETAREEEEVREPAAGAVAAPQAPAVSSMSPAAPAAAPLAREPTPPPPPAPVVKVAFKEWQARRKLERAKEEEEAQEREREKQQELDRERQEREREREKEKEKTSQGEDKENKVVPAPEDGLARILDGIRRSAVSDKPPPEPPAREDVEMHDAPPPPPPPRLPPLPASTVMVEAPTPKSKVTPLSLPAFAATGPERLSPLTVTSSLHSRTPSPRLGNGVKRESSPLVTNGRMSPATTNGISRFVTSPSPLLPSVSSVPTPARAPPVLAPHAPRYPSPTFAVNGVNRPPAKAFTSASASPSPNLATNGAAKRSIPTSPHPPPAKFHTRVPSQEEGEILGSTPPPPPAPTRFGSISQSSTRTSPFASSGPQRTSPLGSSSAAASSSGPQMPSSFTFSAVPPRTAAFAPSPVPPHASPFGSLAAPPTQPRSHQTNPTQRLPPSAPKALREAQSSAGAAATGNNAGGAPRGGRFNGLAPQTMPANILEPPQQRQNRRGGVRRNRR